MRERLSVILSGILLFFLLPCVMTFFLSGPSSCCPGGKIELEKCLPALLYTQLPETCGSELQKAQAVAVRTNVRMQLAEGASLTELLLEYKKNSEKSEDIWKIWMGSWSAYGKAVKETKGEVLTWQGELHPAPYHKISAGMTREGEDVLPGGGYSYLTSVESLMDQRAEEYTAEVRILLSALPEKLEICKRDESGYVLEILADGQTMSGEYFRREMGLPSSCFSMEKDGAEMRFFCRGQGHGLGLSQYGAAVLEEGGKDYEEILEYYYPGMELEEII